MLIGLGVGVLAVIILATSAFTYFMVKFLRIFILISKFDGPPALPVIGNAHQFSKDSREFFLYIAGVMEQYRKKTGGLVRLWLGPKPSLLIYGAKHMEVILSSSRHIKKGFGYNFLEPWLGRGLLNSTGKKWFRRRKMLTPTFHFSILQNFIDVFNQQSNILAEKLDAFADKRDPVNIYPLVTTCALDIICDTAMGKHVNAQNGGENDYVSAVQSVAEVVMKRLKNPLMWPDAVFERTKVGEQHALFLETLHSMTKQVIHEKLHQTSTPLGASYAGNGAVVAGTRKRVAFMDLLIQMHREDPNFTVEDIQEEVDTFMFEGHDTTATGMSWTLLLIGQHPDVQARLHDELDAVLGDTDRHVTTDDLAKLPYMARVLKESHRLIPPVPQIFRTVDEDIVLDGKVVPKETDINLWIHGLHHDPEHFPDPKVFDPDRFLPENNASRHPYAYVPFSAGPRNCIGQRFATMEERVVLCNLLRRFSFQSLQTIDEAKPSVELVTRPAEGKILMKIKRRK